ncbi:MAG: hypothetical protein ACE5NN_05495 [Candidatus Bathyarchaeia archaeon]
MVQLGAYLAEPPAYGQQKYFLPPTSEECTKFLAEECRKARSASEVFTCLNLATPRLDWGLEAAECFHKAGGDFVELNVHGGYEPYLRLGKLRAMVLPENRSELFRWIDAFTELEIPLIVKFREGVIKDYSPVLDKIEDFDLFAVHFNVRDETTKRPDFEFVRDVKTKYPFFLLVSGYVRSGVDAKMLFEAGADMVGIAKPAIEDPRYISKIADELRLTSPS